MTGETTERAPAPAAHRPRRGFADGAFTTAHAAAVAASYALCAVACTWPVAARLGTYAAGRGGDQLVAWWDMWWVERAVRGLRNPLWTRYLFYPDGVDLTYHSTSWLSGLIALPLRLLFGATAGFNLFFLLQATLCGCAMFALARHVTRDTAAAWLAGLVYAFAPYRMTQAMSHPNLAGTMWIPCVLWALLVGLESGRRAPLVLSALCLAFTLLTGAHLFLMTCMAVAFVWAWQLLAGRRMRDAAFWRSTAVFGIAVAVFVGPLLVPFVASRTALNRAVHAVETGSATDAFSYLTPDRRFSWWGRWLARHWRGATTTSAFSRYLGLVPLLLLGVAVARRRVSRGAAMWIVGFVLFVGFALGPELQFHGRTHLKWMPYRLIGWLTPVQALRSPDRFNLIALGFFAIAVAFGYAALNTPSRWRHLRHVLAVVVALEYALIPYPMRRIDVPAFYRSLAARRGHEAVVELPVTRRTSKAAMYMQTFHGRPIVGGMVARMPARAGRYIARSPLLRVLNKRSVPAQVCGRMSVRKELQKLRRDGFSHIVFHTRDYQRISRRLHTYFGVLPGRRDRSLVVYSIRSLLRAKLECIPTKPRARFVPAAPVAPVAPVAPATPTTRAGAVVPTAPAGPTQDRPSSPAAPPAAPAGTSGARVPVPRSP